VNLFDGTHDAVHRRRIETDKTLPSDPRPIDDDHATGMRDEIALIGAGVFLDSELKAVSADLVNLIAFSGKKPPTR
jgi:hypothetical protein